MHVIMVGCSPQQRELLAVCFKSAPAWRVRVTMCDRVYRSRLTRSVPCDGLIISSTYMDGAQRSTSTIDSGSSAVSDRA